MKIPPLICECGCCYREHTFFDEYIELMDAVGGQEKLQESNLTVILKDCDNCEYPFFVVAETEHLKMGASPKGTKIHTTHIELGFPENKAILN